MATNKAYKPQVYNTGIVRGDHFSETFTMTIDGQPLDLSAATIRIQFRDSSTGGLIDEFSDVTGEIVIDTTGDANSFIWTITSGVTQGYDPGAFEYDIEVTINEQPRTYVRGLFSVLEDITV